MSNSKWILVTIRKPDIRLLCTGNLPLARNWVERNRSKSTTVPPCFHTRSHAPSRATGFPTHRSFEGSQDSPMYLRCHKPSQIRSLQEGYNRTLSVPSLGPRSIATSWDYAAVPSAPPTHSSSYVRREQGFTSRRCRVLPRAFKPRLSIVISNYIPFYPLLSRLPVSSNPFKHTHTPAAT